MSLLWQEVPRIWPGRQKKCVNRGPLTCVAFFFLLRQKRSASYAASMVYSIQQSHGHRRQPFHEGFRQYGSMATFLLSRKTVEEYLRIDWETEAERIYSSSMTLAVSSSDSAFPGSPHMKSCLQGMPSIESPLSSNSGRIIGFIHYFISFFFLSFFLSFFKKRKKA